MIQPCFRGELYYAVLGQGIGSEQSGTRPVAVLQNDVGNRYSPTTIVAPISGQRDTKASLPTHYHLEGIGSLRSPSTVLLEQIRVIDKSRLGRKLGWLTQEHIQGIDQAIKISLGLTEQTKREISRDEG